MACLPISQPAQNIASEGVVRLGVNMYLPPFGQPDAAGAPTGFEADLLKTIAARSGLEVELVGADYNQLLLFASDCRLDGVAASITITEELKQVVLFSNPYYSTGQVVVVKEGNVEIRAKEDLIGKLVGTQVNTPSEAELKKVEGVNIKGYETFYAASVDLADGYVEAVVADFPRAASYSTIKRNHLKIVGQEFGRSDYGIAFCKQRDDLRVLFNQGLEEIRASGLLERLIKKWAIKPSLNPAN